MKCPFELPVEAKTDDVAGFNIIDKVGYCVQWQATKEQAEYIVQAINSYEKLVEALRKVIDDHPAGLHTPTEPKSLAQARQALKEAGEAK